MPDAPCRAAPDQLVHRVGEVPDVRRAAALVVDDGHLVAVLGEPQHRAHEVVPGRAEEPRRPDDPGLGPRGRLAEQLRATVCGERIRPVGLDVRLALPAVEHVVGGEGDERRAERSRVRRPADVDRARTLRIALGPVHVGPGGGVEHEVEIALCQVDTGWVRDVPLLARQRHEVVGGEGLLERPAELAAGTGDQDASAQDAASASRADRIGSVLFHRCATRSSFQGIVCSSGSAGSYSSVTW